MDHFKVDSESVKACPSFLAGVLVVRNIAEAGLNSEIQSLKAEIEGNIRQLNKEVLNQLPVIAAYGKYYKTFEKSYHVKAQVESIIKGKGLPTIFPLLDSMFMAEIKNMLLTAGHDLNSLTLPVVLSAGRNDEAYVAMNGNEKKVYKNDFFMKDGQGVISSILNGPDGRTKITPQTKNALFAVYAPAEIGEQTVKAHLEDIKNDILIFSQNSEISLLEVFKTA